MKKMNDKKIHKKNVQRRGNLKWKWTEGVKELVEQSEKAN